MGACSVDGGGFWSIRQQSVGNNWMFILQSMLAGLVCHVPARCLILTWRKVELWVLRCLSAPCALWLSEYSANPHRLFFVKCRQHQLEECFFWAEGSGMASSNGEAQEGKQKKQKTSKKNPTDNSLLAFIVHCLQPCWDIVDGSTELWKWYIRFSLLLWSKRYVLTLKRQNKQMLSQPVGLTSSTF